MFNPYDWYWKASDGRVYASARQRVVPHDDGAFLTFVAEQMPTPWPRDDEGNETAAALQAVLTPYGLFADLAAYAADKRWRCETAGIVVGGIPIATDDRSKQMLLGARVAAMTDPQFATSWVADDGSIHEVDGATITAISDAVLLHVRNCFATYAEVKDSIEAGSIDSIEQVDAAFAAQD